MPGALHRPAPRRQGPQPAQRRPPASRGTRLHAAPRRLRRLPPLPLPLGANLGRLAPAPGHTRRRCCPSLPRRPYMRTTAPGGRAWCWRWSTVRREGGGGGRRRTLGPAALACPAPHMRSPPSLSCAPASRANRLAGVFRRVRPQAGQPVPVRPPRRQLERGPALRGGAPRCAACVLWREAARGQRTRAGTACRNQESSWCARSRGRAQPLLTHLIPAPLLACLL